jgi:chromosome condensin MukBEF MukE localization factor
LSNDGAFEEERTYTEMCDILAAQKPLLVIVNNKSGQSEADSGLVVMDLALQPRNSSTSALNRGMFQSLL